MPSLSTEAEAYFIKQCAHCESPKLDTYMETGALSSGRFLVAMPRRITLRIPKMIEVDNASSRSYYFAPGAGDQCVNAKSIMEHEDS
ncbi:hypothetical protein P879_03932 [Paragonimus westermani]|uniref:Uncharacterized protein n=1 Tax=Paragonimus westermani TaxID=34504 RepID=A0A8T0DDE6_9TREM|nr:hypothetical protein P879_03932 [Paragonimus westermani]